MRLDYAISPETIKNKPYTKAGDIWALGCLAHILATGETPFDFSDYRGNDPRTYCKIYEKIVYHKVPRIPKKWSKAFSDFVSKCFIKYAADRWTIDRLLNHEFMLTA